MGIEAAARQKRYAEFAEKGFDVLALAHHRDDQIETFMLAVARGGGLRALAAMPAVRPLGENGIIWRPLLPFSRQDIWDYARNTVCRISRMKAIPIRLICETASGTVFCPNFRRRFPISGGMC
ncbi:tRNA(Ile)-lysidine synthase [Neisseria gonorrhoeae]|uniref:tRNA(Ile)-lysidine synthetase n=1 Tax=Neisseria gonorrhoeae TaxID=485 RepID=A0A378VY54_NEIGO|nr:tRNA(Ile)-lysidine synthase [Neisseria gonorrhoeae]